jgi:hypothetical protein
VLPWEVYEKCRLEAQRRAALMKAHAAGVQQALAMQRGRRWHQPAGAGAGAEVRLGGRQEREQGQQLHSSLKQHVKSGHGMHWQGKQQQEHGRQGKRGSGLHRTGAA